MAAKNTVNSSGTTALNAPPGELHHPPGGRWISILMLLATGAAITLWTLAQLGTGPALGHGPAWLFVVLVLTSWPLYLGWRYCRRLRIQVAQLQDQGWTGAYLDGYTDGYIASTRMKLSGDCDSQVSGD